jgi:hypothetical protein
MNQETSVHECLTRVRSVGVTGGDYQVKQWKMVLERQKWKRDMIPVVIPFRDLMSSEGRSYIE